MIPDRDTNVVVAAECLVRKFSNVSRGLMAIPTEHSIPSRMIHGTRSVWSRDYMVVQMAEDWFV